MKKTLAVLILLLAAISIFAEEAEEKTFDLSLQFKDKEIIKSYSKITVNGQSATMDKITPFKSLFDGIVSEKTIEITKDKTAKKILEYNFKDIQSANEKVSQMVKPKTIGFEIDAKGKFYNILDNKGQITQKVTGSSNQFPEKPVKVGDTWESNNSFSGITIKTQSTLKEVKEVGKKRFAVINIVIDTPIDISVLMQLMGVTSSSLGGYDQLQFLGYCKGNGEIVLDVDKGQMVRQKINTMLSYQGGLYGQVIMQGQYQVTSEQTQFTDADYKKYAK